jgi:ATP-dependent DNA helicase RecQ
MPRPADFDAAAGLFIDIESVPGGNIFGLGAVYGAAFREEAMGERNVAALVRELRARAGRAKFIAGHNVLSHDLPSLEAVYPLPEFRALPVIDTLYLSPLAFPRNPYHRLTKNDRLARSSKNHPARDCESSRVILEDAAAAFRAMLGNSREAERLALTRWLLSRAELPWNGSKGFELLFSSLGVPILSDHAAEETWITLTAGMACAEAVRRLWSEAESSPALRATLAYVLAWLQVAGSDSVLPGWVRHQFAQTGPVVRRLRATPCGDAACVWCNENQSPTRQLKRFFGYQAYRAQPAVSDRPHLSLQEEIVRLGMGGQSLLGILPTGGGKSLCFQVPALHRFLTTGALTIVVTPLQALMKDQVDGLVSKTSLTCVAALNGMQTPPEKAEVREAVRLGGIGILYVSPEQLRNSSFKRAIIQREIGCWVFDEAHCLSQWGHDFRPDYVYIARYIRELAAEQGVPIPPVACVTATAKDDVKNEIVDHFRTQLGLDLVTLDGGTARQNLSYRIEEVREQEKVARLHQLMAERISDGVGAAVVFAATRKRVQEFATVLAAHPYRWSCAAFHAGLSAEEKKGILEDYLGGRIQVVVATNAFGMGIDKPNIRLVVHMDAPGSLENYLQEAGRAGRDEQAADCVLLYNPEDLETQFGLLAMSKIDKRDIDQIWRAILRADRGDGKSVTLTISEILNDFQDSPSFGEESEEQRGTKVRTALAVLEKQGFLERDENQTKVFQARALVADEEAARARISKLDLPESTRALWVDVLNLLLAQDQEMPVGLDDFAELPRMKERYAWMRGASRERVSPYAPVFQVLNEMARPEVGLISKDVLFSAHLRVGPRTNAGHLLKVVSAQEHVLLELLRDAEPNPDGWIPLALRRANEHLLEANPKSLPEDVIQLLKTLDADGRKMGRPAGLLELRQVNRDQANVRLSGTWTDVRELSSLRLAAARVLVDLLLGKAKARAEAEKVALVEFAETEVIEAFKEDMTLDLTAVRDVPSFIQYLLVYLHEHDVIELKNGKALISQAMNLRVLENKKGKQRRQFTKGDYATLLVHYSEKVFQIHVMGEYARMGVERLGAHLRLISAYFQMGKAAFAARFLREKPEVYERATGLDSFKKIVDALGNPVQQAIVAEPQGANLLILAGPGSGKTRVIAHRCAYLLRVERVRSERILVACYNRHAALQLRRQIYKLAGKNACGVMIQTYHGLALRLLGRSLGGAMNGDELPDFSRLLEDATTLLTGTKEEEGIRSEESRDRILGGFSHILVDEYQDVDEREYAFISAIAGRTETEEDRKLSIIAVGDDDQSIYAFKGANVEFIRRFQHDYKAREHYLTQNYRSTKAIIAAANRLITHNTDRMKIAHALRIDQRRSGDPAGGRWEALDPVTRGRVQRVFLENAAHQAHFVAEEIKRVLALDPSQGLSSFAVLARTRSELASIRAALDDHGIPVDWRADDEMPVSPFKIREVHDWLTYLEGARGEAWTVAETKARLAHCRGEAAINRWWRFLEFLWSEWAGEAGDAEVHVSMIREFFVECIAERQRDHRVGEGVVLTTAHKAKGLEFPHVFIADGGWRRNDEMAKVEEERRVFYVAVTRARETLAVLVQKDRRSPFPPELTGEHVIDRTPRIAGPDDSPCCRRYDVIDPKKLYLSYAASMPDLSPVHRALRATCAGDTVRLVTDGRWVHIQTMAGVPIAALSEAGRAEWAARLDSIRTATVCAMVRRTTEQETEPYRAKAVVPIWEYPIVEVCWTASTPAPETGTDSAFTTS